MSLTRTSKRLVSLDVLRGITVCGMILVNNAGACGYAYAPLKHAKWDGFTPADLVFPAFMFIMGVSIYLSLNKSNFDWRVSIARILRRTALIFVSGVSLKWILAFIATGEPKRQVQLHPVCAPCGGYEPVSIVGSKWHK